ncbi:hypothetical protein B0H19DRAFT_1266831 [Mycena capillaripes]|nr:hypothetical protein B0H19DRAFT_1266831 [Mycena capillaripes]
MKLIAVLLAAVSVAVATPTLTSFGAAGCSGTSLATWSGVPENAFCQATPGAISLSDVPGTSKCEIDLYTSSNCDGTNGQFITTVPDVAGCFTASEQFASVRILCITTG